MHQVTLLYVHVDWKSDGWSFKQSGHYNVKFKEEGETLVGHKWFEYTNLGNKNGKAVLLKEFKREIFAHPSFPLRRLIHYIGDCTLQVEKPHGNSKDPEKLARSHVRTKPSKLNEMKTRNGAAGVVYKAMVCEAGGETAIEHQVNAPRDLKQVKNAQQQQRAKLEISRDSFYNLHAMKEESNFIRYLTTIPDLIAIMCSLTMLLFVKGLLNRKDLPLICFSYDTTFDLGDCYVSILVVRFVEFTNSPIIPVMFMIHEKKTKEAHQLFFQKITQFFPEVCLDRVDCIHLYNFVFNLNFFFIASES